MDLHLDTTVRYTGIVFVSVCLGASSTVAVDRSWTTTMMSTYSSSAAPHHRHLHPQYVQQQPPQQPQQHPQLMADCQEIIQLLTGSNASVRGTPFGKNCVELLRKRLDDGSVAVDDADLDAPGSGLAVYAFATPFILIIGNAPPLRHGPMGRLWTLGRCISSRVRRPVLEHSISV